MLSVLAAVERATRWHEGGKTSKKEGSSGSTVKIHRVWHCAVIAYMTRNILCTCCSKWRCQNRPWWEMSASFTLSRLWLGPGQPLKLGGFVDDVILDKLDRLLSYNYPYIWLIGMTQGPDFQRLL